MKSVLYKTDRVNYSRNFKVSIIISLSVVILFILFMPDYKDDEKGIPSFPELRITLIDIPNTEQKSHAAPPKPMTPIVSTQFQPVDDLEPLPDIEIKESSDNPGNKKDIGKSLQGTGKEIYEASSFPFVPRQTLEVIPEKSEGINGSIKLKVLIGVDGIVKKYIVLNNTIDSDIVLKNVVEAARKSRWEPISIEGQKVEYWIEKTYVFN